MHFTQNSSNKQTQSTHKKSPPWACDKGCAEACAEHFSALKVTTIHKWRTRGKKLVPSHESEALEGKQTLQMKTFSELAECLARIPPKITFYGLLLKYNYKGCLLLLMFSIDLLFAIKRDAYIFKETRWFCRFPKHQKLHKRAMAGEKQQTCWPKLHIETEFESQLTAIR